jgi:hypothetical protein
MMHTPQVMPTLEIPLERMAEHWPISDRARFERLWWAMTYVLCETWEHKSTEARDFFATLPRTADLNIRLRELKKAGVIERMRECRHYMFHRDDRTYFDVGRAAPVGDLQTMLGLSQLFGAVFREALDTLKERKAASGQADSSRDAAISDAAVHSEAT